MIHRRLRRPMFRNSRVWPTNLSAPANDSAPIRRRLSAPVATARSIQLGFGLENFTAAGKWRTEERQFTKNRKGRIQLSKTATPIDTSGKFHNGSAFANYFELRDRIAERKDDFARGFTEHLIEYALGRPFGFIDEDLAKKVIASAKNQKYAVREFIQSLVLSQTFRKK